MPKSDLTSYDFVGKYLAEVWLMLSRVDAIQSKDLAEGARSYHTPYHLLGGVLVWRTISIKDALR